MRVAHLSHADARGGANIGARRNHEAMKNNGIDSSLFVVEKYSDDKDVIKLTDERGDRKFAEKVNTFISTRYLSSNKIVRSYNLVQTSTYQQINTFKPDIVQLHWIGQNVLGISELQLIKAPIVWKLPDMWPFSGSEHYAPLGNYDRYITGYSTENKIRGDSGWDIDRHIWRLKKLFWKNINITIITPSKWLAREASRSHLFRDREVHHINNPINTERFTLLKNDSLRLKLGLDPSKKTIIFGALNADSDKRKGFEDISQLLPKFIQLNKTIPLQLLIFGVQKPSFKIISGLPIHKFAQINSSTRLIELYNSADILLFPSRQDNSPNIVKEASCCGVLTVGYNIGGIPDLVTHLNTGYLAQPFSTEDLFTGILWALKTVSNQRRQSISDSARRRHDESIAVGAYYKIYENLTKSKRN